MSPSFGRGAMTNSWADMQNSKCFLIAGSNCAENHPIAMRWINRAREKYGAKIIVVDPRFTRTASKADIFAQIRPGTDIAYLGAIINYIIEKKLYDEYFVLNFTNALFKINKDYKFEDGLFSGFDAEKKKYATASWAYELEPTSGVEPETSALPRRNIPLPCLIPKPSSLDTIAFACLRLFYIMAFHLIYGNGLATVSCSQKNKKAPGFPGAVFHVKYYFFVFTSM